MAAENTGEASSGGMPQLDFTTFPNQAFWLVMTLLCLFLMVRFIIIPRMDNILANRRKVVEEDLVGAEKFREAAEELTKSITNEVDEARVRAAEIIGNSKETIKQNRQKGIEEASEMVNSIVTNSEKTILKMQKDAKKQIEKISADLTPEIVSKLSGNKK